MWEPNNREQFRNITQIVRQRLCNREIQLNLGEILYVYSLPSFDNWYAWTVFNKIKETNRRELKLSKIIWRRDIDYNYANNTPPWLFGDKPTFEEIYVPLPRDKFDDLIQQGQQIHIPAIHLDTSFGLDGTTYGFIQESVRLEWWESGPSEWKDLTQWFQLLIQFFEQQLN